MTLDKIEVYMPSHIFEYWTVTFFKITKNNYELQKSTLTSAITKLSSELSSGVVKGIEYTAELNLLKHLLK